MKIALILAADKRDPLVKSDPFMPLSLPLLAASAPDHDYTLVNMLSGEKVNFKKKYDVVGISARLTAENIAYQIADIFRQKGVTVILGGPQMSAVPFKAIGHADAVVIGEGESLWPVLLNDIDNKDLKDFYISSPHAFDAPGYRVHQISDYLDLKKVSVPARSLYKNRYTFDSVFASRGCPIDCDFCSVSGFFGKKIRTRPVEDVVNEIKTFKSYYYLLDDTVFGRPSHYEYYLELYKQISSLKRIKYWTGQANLDAAASEKGREVIRAASRAGLIYAAIGMESINPQVLKKSGVIHKVGAKDHNGVLEQMKENIRFIQEEGIIISGWFTIGYEEDTIETYYKTLEFCNEMKILPVISPLEAIPGTRLYDRLIAEKRVNSTKKINIVHPTMQDDDVISAWSEVNNLGFNMKQILRRTKYYAKFFDKDNTNINSKIYNRIHKTIFAYILQVKIRKGVMGFANDY